ncbi:MAG: hypothetical protein RIQ60_1593 [Pseudomonadota bacterium]|jgi:hypothetical protein
MASAVAAAVAEAFIVVYRTIFTIGWVDSVR